MANQLGVSQNALSKLERGETSVSEDQLTKISGLLNVPKELIENFSDNVFFDSCTSSGMYNHYTNNINPIDEIKVLYERLLEEKTKTIKDLEAELKNKAKKNA